MSHQVYDSRGYPTIATELTLDSGDIGYAFVPSGASTGQFEVAELRDDIPEVHHGKGVHKAINNIQTQLKDLIIGQSFANQAEFDRLIKSSDSCLKMSQIGANAILSLSKSLAKAMANAQREDLFLSLSRSESTTHYQLPIPILNVINGGVHADNPLYIQEFMIVPHGFEKFSDAMRAGSEIYHHLKQILRDKNLSTNVGDEGGFAPNLLSNESALDLLIETIQRSGYAPEKEVSIALDVAASEFYQDEAYLLEKHYSTDAWVAYLEGLTKNYPIISIEDPFADTDENSWANLYRRVHHDCMLVGDDLIVTQLPRLKKALHHQLANAILIKPNQVGTISDTLETIEYAKAHQCTVFISHRSGDTEDTFISDLAVATSAKYIKSGAPCRSERLAKYNRLLWLEKKHGLLLNE